MRQAARGVIRGAILGIIVAASALPASAKPFDQMVPEKTTVFVSVRNVSDLGKRLDASPLGELWKSAEMEPFVKRVSDAFSAALVEVDKEAGFKLADYKEIFHGEVALAIGDPAGMDFQAEALELPLAVLVDVGPHHDKAAEFLKKTFEKESADGKARRREESFRGETLHIFESKEKKKGEPKELVIVLARDLLAVSLSRPYLQDILANRAENAVKSLSEHADYRAVRGKYGKDSDLFLYGHVGQWLDQLPRLVKAGGDENAERQLPIVKQVLDLLGLSTVRAVAGSSALTPEGIAQTLFVLAPGEPKGVLKMLWNQPQPLKFPSIVPDDVNSCTLALVDLDAVWTMVQDGVKVFMGAMAGGQAPEGAPNPIQMFEMQLGINFQEDLLATLGKQVLVYDRLKKPYTLESQTVALLLELKNREKFAATLDKLTMLGRMEKKEYLGRTIYAARSGEEGEGASGPALCVTDTHFVFATARDLAEEAVRRVGKEVKSVNDSPAFKAVAGRYPATALAITYQSPDIFEYWIDLAKQFSKSGMMGLAGMGAGMDDDEEEEEEGDKAGKAPRKRGRDAGKRFGKAVQEALGKLPEAGVITRRIGASMSYGFAEDRGIGATSLILFKATSTK